MKPSAVITPGDYIECIEPDGFGHIAEIVFGRAYTVTAVEPGRGDDHCPTHENCWADRVTVDQAPLPGGLTWCMASFRLVYHRDPTLPDRLMRMAEGGELA